MKEILSEIRKQIRTRENGPAVDSMKAHGIVYRTNHGLSIAEIKSIAGKYKKNHELAIELWGWDHREFRILATMIDDPEKVLLEQMAVWSRNFTNAEIAEQCAINLAYYSPLHKDIIKQWLNDENPWAIKAGLVLLAWTAQRNPSVDLDFLEQQLYLLPRFIQPEQMSVVAGVSFALRAIGKRNKSLNKQAIAILNLLKNKEDYATRFVVEEALWELESDIIQERLKNKEE